MEIGPEEVSEISSGVLATPLPRDLLLNCSQLLTHDSLLMLGREASCAWQNTQQRAIVITLSSSSQVREGSVLGISENTLRTRHVLYSRPVHGSVVVRVFPEAQTYPEAVIEGASLVPMCAGVLFTGENSLYGGAGNFEYEWRMGMELDESGSPIPDPLLAPYIPSGFTTQSNLQIPATVVFSSSDNSSTSFSGSGDGGQVSPSLTYFIQLRVRNFLGLNSSAVMHNVTLSGQLFSPAILVVGGQTHRTLANRETLMEGKVLNTPGNCGVESCAARYSWRVIEEAGGMNVTLEGIRRDSLMLLLPANTLMPGRVYTVTFSTIASASEQYGSRDVSVTLETVEEIVARLSGGVRRAVSSEDGVELDGTASTIQHTTRNQVGISWNCSTVSVPELSSMTASCSDFSAPPPHRLTLWLPPGVLPPGGYHFTLTLSLMDTRGNVILESSTIQLIIVFPHSIPMAHVVRVQGRDSGSVLVHEKALLEVEVKSSLPGQLVWSSEYVIGKFKCQLIDPIMTIIVGRTFSYTGGAIYGHR